MIVTTIEMHIDLPLLLRQKQAVLRAIANAQEGGESREVELLMGVLHTLDFIHDTASPPNHGG